MGWSSKQGEYNDGTMGILNEKHAPEVITVEYPWEFCVIFQQKAAVSKMLMLIFTKHLGTKHLYKLYVRLM